MSKRMADGWIKRKKKSSLSNSMFCILPVCTWKSSINRNTIHAIATWFVRHETFYIKMKDSSHLVNDFEELLIYWVCDFLCSIDFFYSSFIRSIVRSLVCSFSVSLYYVFSFFFFSFSMSFLWKWARPRFQI